MNILEAITSAQGGDAVRQLGGQFGLNEDQVKSALSGLVPALSVGFKKNMTSAQGMEGLLGALAGGKHQRYVDDAMSLARADTTTDGNKILGHVLGSKDASRQVASQVAAKTGIDDSILKKMLPIVAAQMMGALSKQAPVGASKKAAGTGGAGLLAMLTPMLDADGDGSVTDDLMGKLGGLLKG